MVSLAALSTVFAACGGDDSSAFLQGGPDAAPGRETDATVGSDGAIADGSADVGTDGTVRTAPDSGPGCTAGTVCSGACVNTTSDGSNCGACGKACAAGSVCSAGSCQLTCAAGTVACGSSCVETSVNPNDCGACGHVCPGGMVCSAGTCAVVCGSGLTKCAGNGTVGGGGDAGADAGDGGVPGVDLCVDALSDRTNCGACGVTCGSGQVCSEGTCAASCQAGLVQCGSTCVDPLSNAGFCGATAGCGSADAGDAGSAGTACAGGQVCAAGVCQTTCGPNQIDCSGTCIDPNTNGDFCGAAGNCTNLGAGNKAGTICAAGQICNGSGQCAISCQPGQVKCGTACVDPLTNGNFCGASGACDPTGGTAGTVCPGGTVCTNVHGVGTCELTCAQGLVDCNGTCVDPKTNASYCGASGSCVAGTPSAGTKCGPGTVCNGSGTCQISCQSNEVLCGTTCIDPNTNETFCGAAGTCDGTPGNSQGTPCTGNQVCNGGSCQVSCAAGLVNCNGTCIDPTTNNSFCGASGACSAVAGTTGASCASGTLCEQTPGGPMCEANCSPGFSVCGNTCVNEQVNPNHCGSCNACAPRSNVTEQDCITGSCAIGTCSAGYTDCNGFIEDGCEDHTATDANNCGACGFACPAGNSCDGNTCYPVTASCADLQAAFPSAPDGVYNIQPAGVATPFPVVCDMTRDGGGWTLILKATSSSVFDYNSPYWTNTQTLNTTDLTTNPADAKYPSFSTVPVTTMRGELDGFTYQLAVGTVTTADQVFNGGSQIVSPYPVTDPNANFVPEANCQYYGIDTPFAFAQARFGWTANNEDDCATNDTAIGLGLTYLGDNSGAGYIAFPGGNITYAPGNGLLWVK